MNDVLMRRNKEAFAQKYKPAAGSFIKIQPEKDGKFRIIDVISKEGNDPGITQALKIITGMTGKDELLLDEGYIKVLMHKGLFEQIMVQDKPFRTPDQAQKHSAEVKAVIKELLNRYGLVFNGERAGDLSVREGAENFIAKDFMFDGSGPDGEIRFRRITQGQLGRPFSADELINYYFNSSSPIIDRERTQHNRDKALNEFKETKLGGKKRNQMTMEEAREFDRIVGKDFEDATKISRRMYSTKVLPKYNEHEVKQRLEDEATTTYGLPKKTGAQFQYDEAQHYKITRYVEDNFEKINSLHSYSELKELNSLEAQKQSWDGITNE